MNRGSQNVKHSHVRLKTTSSKISVELRARGRIPRLLKYYITAMKQWWVGPSLRVRPLRNGHTGKKKSVHLWSCHRKGPWGHNRKARLNRREAIGSDERDAMYNNVPIAVRK